MKVITDNPTYKTGIELAPKVDIEIHDERTGRLKWWYGCVCIGEEYYETDRYLSKGYAISEMLGYIEGLEVLIKTEIDNLKEMIK